MWLTTDDAAKLLAVSTRWVRWLARHGELPCELTESGQRIFKRSEVRRVLIQRTEDQARQRPAVLRAVRVRMLKAGFEPRQLSFLPRLLKLVAGSGERALPHAEVKAARSFEKIAGSKKRNYVDRKVTGGSHR
jgi:excisionase family DNA binding protein